MLRGDLTWRTDEIEPTYSTGDSFGWRLDQRIDLEVHDLVPVVAWAEFSDRQGEQHRHLLCTFQLDEYGLLQQFQTWRIGPPDTDGRQCARRVSGAVTSWYLPDEERGGHSYSHVSPVLHRLHRQAVQRRALIEDAERRRRAEDPLRTVIEELFELGIGVAGAVPGEGPRRVRAALDARISGLDRSDVNEVLARMAIDYAADVIGAVS